MLVFTPAGVYLLSSYIFVGERFFIRYWRASSSLEFGSSLFILGERRGEEPFEESLMDVFGVFEDVEEFEVVVVLLLSRMKFRPPWPKPEEFLMDCRSPN